MTKKISASVDRIEGNYLICINDENSEEILLSKSDFPFLREMDVIEILFENDSPVSAKKKHGESEERLKNNTQRLRNLFKKK